MKLTAAILSVVLVGILYGAIPQALGLRIIPHIHDEFGYLLEADTFLHGRLTNPPHALPQYFQTEHQLMSPTYMAKFPAGQGLALAAGRLLGDPIIGAYGMIALACGAIVWTIRAWLPLRWALFGGLLAIAHPLAQLWSQNFWGGGVQMLAGALLTGAALRAARRLRPRYALIAAIGVSLLLISRPFEGCIYTLLIAIYLLATWQKRHRPWPAVGRFILLGGVCLLPIAAFILYDNYRITGSPLQNPYALYAARYQRAPLLFLQSPNTHLDEMPPKLADYRDEYEFGEYNDQTTFRGYCSATIGKIREIGQSWLRWNLSDFIDPFKTGFHDPIGAVQHWLTYGVFLLPLPWLVRARRVRWLLLLVIGLPVAQMILTPWMRMHYLAPAAGSFFLMLTLGARALSRWRVGLLLSLLAIGLVHFDAIAALRFKLGFANPLGYHRVEMIDQLIRRGGQHVIVVRYTPGKQEIFEWVFNDADIDSQTVIWTRDRDPSTLRDLQGLYPTRYFWQLTVRGDSLDFGPLAAPLR